MSDALKQYQFKSEGGGLFLKFSPDEPVKVRVLTTDPLINVDNYGNTRYAFVVYNFTEGKAQILNKGVTVSRQIQALHQDEDYGADIQKLDIKITATGEGKETRYSVNPLPKSEKLTDEQVTEAREIDLEKVIGGGIRMSEAVKSPEKEKSMQSEEQPPIESFDEDPDSDVDLESIPF